MLAASEGQLRTLQQAQGAERAGEDHGESRRVPSRHGPGTVRRLVGGKRVLQLLALNQVLEDQLERERLGSLEVRRAITVKEFGEARRPRPGVKRGERCGRHDLQA